MGSENLEGTCQRFFWGHTSDKTVGNRCSTADYSNQLKSEEILYHNPQMRNL